MRASFGAKILCVRVHMSSSYGKKHFCNGGGGGGRQTALLSIDVVICMCSPSGVHGHKYLLQ